MPSHDSGGLSARRSKARTIRLAGMMRSFAAKLFLVLAIVSLASLASLAVFRTIVASLHASLYSAVGALEVVHASENFHSRLHSLLVAAEAGPRSDTRRASPEYLQARSDALAAFEVLKGRLAPGSDPDRHLRVESDSGLLSDMGRSLASFLVETDGSIQGGAAAAGHFEKARGIFDTIFSRQLEIVHDLHEARLATIKTNAHSLSQRADLIFYLLLAAVLLAISLAGILAFRVLAHDFRKAESGAYIDGLTGAKNRRYLEGPARRMMGAMIESQMVFSMAMCDIDRFKDLNDRFGHQSGDLALIAVTNALIAGLRNNDMIIRFGGEEFLIVLPGTDKDASCRTVEKLRLDVATLRVPLGDGQSLEMTASFGIASFPGDSASDYENLLRLADERLYAAKRGGRNRVISI